MRISAATSSSDRPALGIATRSSAHSVEPGEVAFEAEIGDSRPVALSITVVGNVVAFGPRQQRTHSQQGYLVGNESPIGRYCGQPVDRTMCVGHASLIASL